MQKNDILTGKVVDFGVNGEGIIKQDGNVVFVPFAIKDETVKYKVLKVNKNIAYGKLLEVIDKSGCRREPICPVFYKCGGCNLQHVLYNEQLKIKQKNIKDAFYKIAKIDVNVEDVVVGNEFYYRNKLQLPVRRIDGENFIGFFAENSHRVIQISDCYINAKWCKDIIKSFKKYFNVCNVHGFDEIMGKGDVKEITVKEINKNLIISIITPTKNIKEKEKLIEILKENLHFNFSLYQNVNKSNDNIIYGEEFYLLYGEPSYTSNMLGISYKIGVRSFMQVNSVVCEKLYRTVSELVGIDKDTTVIDAYSGAGLMTAILSINAKKAIGIEIIPEAVELANELKGLNGLSEKITNYQGKCEEIMPDIIDKINGKKAIVVDPPRKGCDIKVIDAIIKSGVDRIIYVSCMPSTLSRDVGLIVGTLEFNGKEIVNSNGEKFRYKVERVIPFDMFANTKHVETLCVLNKIKGN